MTAPAAERAVVLMAAAPAHAERAAALASDLALPLVASPPPDAGAVLVVDDDGLHLREPAHADRGGLHVDFRAIDPRTVARGQPLGRAMGGEAHTVVDATAGMGHDAALLALMGFAVTAIERSAVLHAMLAAALGRGGADDRATAALRANLAVMHGDARELLPALDPAPDVVYLDPMFPPKRKRGALAPLAIRLVRAVVGDDPDAAELLAVARRVARRRVVVKRPVHAPPVAEGASGAVTSKVARYDVYGRG